MKVYGRNVVLEALTTNTNISKIFIQEQIPSKGKIEEIIVQAKQQSVPIEYISIQELAKSTNNANHQGVIAEVTMTSFSSLKKFLDADEHIDAPHNSFLYIIEAQLSQNLGAIARTAEVAGIRGIIIPLKQNITAEAVKVSTGALFTIPIIQESIFNTIKTAKSNGYSVIGIERDGETYYNATLSQPTLFIIGGEDKEISDTVRKKCDTIVEIPQYGFVNSLNMSVAAAVVLFEHIKQLEHV